MRIGQGKGREGVGWGGVGWGGGEDAVNVVRDEMICQRGNVRWEIKAYSGFVPT